MNGTEYEKSVFKICAEIDEKTALFSPIMPIPVVAGKYRRILHVTQEYFGYQSNRHIVFYNRVNCKT